MKRKAYIILSALLLLLIPRPAHAQLDALIDVVVDAVEPTPVYDTGLREATEDLASKIDRLNHVLFGGAEATSAAYRYRTMYSDLYDLTTTFSSYVDRSYSNAKRLERMYSSMENAGIGAYARNIQDTWYVYESTVREGGRIVAQFKKLFSDPNTTNAEVRSAAKEAVEELKAAQEKEERRVQEELQAAEVTQGLIECAAFLTPSPETYVSEGKKMYGTTISQGGSSSATGTLGTAVMIIIGLMSVMYALFTGIHIMKGSRNASILLGRLILFLVISLVIILAIQHNI